MKFRCLHVRTFLYERLKVPSPITQDGSNIPVEVQLKVSVIVDRRAKDFQTLYFPDSVFGNSSC